MDACFCAHRNECTYSYMHVCTCECVHAAFIHVRSGSQWFFTYEDFILATLRGSQNVFFEISGVINMYIRKKGSMMPLCEYYIHPILCTYSKICWILVVDIGNFHCPNIPATLDTASNRKEYQGYLLKGKGGRCVGLSTLLPSCTDLLESLDVSVSWNPNSLSRQYMYQFFSVEATRTHSDTHSR